MIRAAILSAVIAAVMVYAQLQVAEPLRPVVAVEQPSPKVLTLEQWRWVHRHFPTDEYRAARTTWCESRFRDDLVGAAGELGRLQTLPVHAVEFGYAPAQLRDPEVTGAVDAKLLARQPGWVDWTTADGCASWPK